MILCHLSRDILHERVIAGWSCEVMGHSVTPSAIGFSFVSAGLPFPSPFLWGGRPKKVLESKCCPRLLCWKERDFSMTRLNAALWRKSKENRGSYRHCEERRAQRDRPWKVPEWKLGRVLSVIRRVSFKRLCILYFSMGNNERKRAKSCVVHRASACDTQCLKDSWH